MSCSQCFEKPPTLSPTYGAGTVQELGGLQTYATGSPHSMLAILLISDIYAVGFLVVVPDFFYDDPVIDLNDPNFDVNSWIKVHNTDKGYEAAKAMIAALKSKGVSAIGAGGFCWGVLQLLTSACVIGTVAVKLASSTDLQAVVLLHPSSITEYHIDNVKVPIAILGVENDNLSPLEKLKQFGEKLSAKSEDKGYEDAKAVIAALKSKGVSAIGAAGFCWGDVKIHIAILGAEIDQRSPVEKLIQFGEKLSAKSEVSS
nr:endo-1,3-1,4-beta-d-glucanase [Quercus suber]